MFHIHLKCNKAVKFSGSPSARTVVRTVQALSRNGSIWFLIKRNKEDSHLINEPGLFLPPEVFKRKTAASADYRMLTLSFISNLSESTRWREKDPPKSAPVNLICLVWGFWG